MSKRRHNTDVYQPGGLTHQQGHQLETIQAVHYSGPLPPPAALQAYEDVCPGAADRIIAMAERQATHREALEKAVVDANIAAQERGSNRAFAICLISICGGVVLLMTGHPIAGYATMLGSVGTLAGVFVFSRNQQARERSEKEAAVAKAQR